MDNPQIDSGGNKFWYTSGCPSKLHRTDGPAVKWADGEVWWCLNAACYTFDEWLEINSDLPHEEKVMMKLQYG
jgi:hypothetical protein